MSLDWSIEFWSGWNCRVIIFSCSSWLQMKPLSPWKVKPNAFKVLITVLVQYVSICFLPVFSIISFPSLCVEFESVLFINLLFPSASVRLWPNIINNVFLSKKFHSFLSKGPNNYSIWKCMALKIRQNKFAI